MNGLTCECPDYGGEGWMYFPPDDFSILQTKRRRRCKSCKELIDKGALCLEFGRMKYPETDFEISFYGDDTEIDLPAYYMCESCGEQYLNLSELGFCVDILSNMFELLEQYKHDYQQNR